MKLALYSLLAFSIITIGVIKLSGNSNAKTLEVVNKPQGKTLIVYYSQSKNKNTETIAKWINNSIGGDLYEIEMIEPYSDSYKKVLKESKEQIDNNTLPAIKPFDKKLADYDTIFIGSPIWYGTYAPPVATFLANNNLKDKFVIPFCTHGGGGAGHFYEDINKNAKGALITPNGFTAKGSNIVERTFGYGTKNKVSQDDIVKWLNQIFK